MEIFSRNMKYLRLLNNLTQSEIKDRIGIEPTTWSNYERGKSFPNLQLFHVISKYFGVSESDLLNTILENGAKQSNSEPPEYGANNGAKHGANQPQNRAEKEHYKIETSNAELIVRESESTFSEHANNVFDLKSKAAAGTVAQIIQDGDKRMPKPNLYLPGLGPGIHIRIPIAGDSMHSTIKDGDRAVGTLITDLRNIRPGFVYHILDNDDGFVCKRLYWEGDELEFVSDNEIYKPYKRSLNDLFAIFKVREVHSRDLRPYFLDVRREMREIRSEMAAIRSLITK